MVQNQQCTCRAFFSCSLLQPLEVSSSLQSASYRSCSHDRRSPLCSQCSPCRCRAWRFQNALQRIEDAMATMHDPIFAGEMRQVLQTGRTFVGTFCSALQSSELQPASPLWLHLMQAALESAVRGAVMLNAEPAVFWRLHCLQGKLELCRELLQSPGDSDLQRALANVHGIESGAIAVDAALAQPTTLQVWQTQLQQVQAMQEMGCLPICVQIRDRVAEMPALLLQIQEDSAAELIRAAQMRRGVL